MNKKSFCFSLVKMLLTLAIIALVCTLLLPARAQASDGSSNAPVTITTNQPVAAAPGTNAPETTFFDSLGSYFSSFNPALTNSFGTNKTFDIWTGAEYVSGLNTADDLGIEYQAPWFATATTHLSLESVTKNAGIAGTILAEQGGIGLNYVYVDTKLTAYVDGGYSFLNEVPYAEIGVRVKKALTLNTYLGTGLSVDVGRGQKNVPNLVLFTGFSF